MPIPRKYLLSVAALCMAGAVAAQAATADMRSMRVDLPDGSVAYVQYTGDVAPKVEIQPVDARSVVATDPFSMPVMMPMSAAFAEMTRISALMDRQAAAMMQQAAIMQREALDDSPPNLPTTTMVGTRTLPKGTYFSYVSSVTDGNGCTRTVSYNSDGAGGAPRLTRAASDGCGAASPGKPLISTSITAPSILPSAPGQRI